MSNDFDDSYEPGVQLHPLKGWEDLADILDPVTGRMISPVGSLTGMTIEEATKRAWVWWEKTARFQMPDYGKSERYLNGYGMKSGVLLGRPWHELNRGEMIHVVKQWHTHIGFPMHGLSVTNEKDYKNAIKSIQETEQIRAFDLRGIFKNPHGNA